ncbi:MAG: NAD-dependent epimerase/dehydratase family protein [Candidatus Aminicenantales bacterium]
MKALVTGASGFIGRRLASTLARRGHDVVCLVRRTSRTACLEGLPVKLVVGDLRDPASLDAAVAGRDWVFHLAGVVQAARESAFEAANVEGTRHLVEACLRRAPGLERFVLVSSIAAAGPSAADRPGTEEDEPRPVTAYGRSKLRAEGIVLEAAHRLPATIIRPPNVLGPGSKELERAIGLVRRRIVPAIGDSRPRTSLVDVDDLIEALLLAASSVRSAGRTYYVTDGRAYAWPEIMAALTEELGAGRARVRVPHGAQILAAWLAEAAARLTGKPPALTRDIVRAGHDHFWIYDGSRIRRELGFRPRSTMRDSLRRAVRESGAKAGPKHGRDKAGAR